MNKRKKMIERELGKFEIVEKKVRVVCLHVNKRKKMIERELGKH